MTALARPPPACGCCCRCKTAAARWPKPSPAAHRLPSRFLNGPEGGLSPAEEAAAIACGFSPVTLGPRVLRAETAPLAVLAALLCY